jgi:hypothetical protein
LPECCDETWPELKSDAEDEQDQPEFFHKLEGVMIDRFSEVTDKDAGEKDTGSAEADTTKLQTAQCHPGDADNGENADGMCDRLGFVELKEPAHAFTTMRFCFVAPLSDLGLTACHKQRP